MTEPRRFTKRQRIALWLAADGQCSICGEPLPSSWHADHVTPYSRGGATDVLNGQALCPTCNLQKGAYLATRQELNGVVLRQWQEGAIDKFHELPRTDFTISATPGSGKTTAALMIALSQMEEGRIERIVVVVPTSHLKTQWCEAASKFGLDLDPDLSNGQGGGETQDFSGCCVTYHQVAFLPDLHRHLCRRRTMVIFDEIHHAGDQRTWGDALRHAFDGAVLRLCLTGTPFREDGRPIPFVRYDESGRCVVDYPYTYGDALRDGAVRNIVFPTFEGDMTWWSAKHGELTATFSDPIPTEEESRRLKTALDPLGDWMRDVIRQADDRLQEVRRNTFPAAAGLIVAMDQTHARAIAKTMRDLIGVDPVVALSDDADASRKIREFAEGRAASPRWLIAVRMVSEGVDIPRLFVGIWATNTLTNLFFRQVVGRFVRLLPGVEDQTGYLFIPKVDPLIEYVETIKTERDASLRTQDEDDDSEPDGADRYTLTTEVSTWTPYSATAIEGPTYIGDEMFTPSDMSEVRKMMVATGLEGSNPAIVALIYRRTIQYLNATAPNATPPVVEPVPVNRPTVHRQREALRRKVTNLVNRYVQARRDAGYEIEQKSVHATLKRLQGCGQAEATIEQLKERQQLLSEWIDEVGRERR